MSKQTFDFSEALKRMRQGKKVGIRIMGILNVFYFEKDKQGEECLMETVFPEYIALRKPHPVTYIIVDLILATDWEEVMNEKEI